MIWLVQRIWHAAGWRLVALVTLIVIAVLLEGAVFASLLPLLVVSGVGQLGPRDQGAFLLEFFAEIGIPLTPAVAALLTISLLLMTQLAVLSHLFGRYAILRRCVLQFKKEMIETVLAGQWSFILEKGAVDLSNLFANPINVALRGALNALVEVFALGALVGVYLALALYFSWQMTLLALVAGIPIFMVSRVFTTWTKRISAECFRSSQAEFHLLQESFRGVKLIKSTAAEPLVAAWFNSAATRVEETFLWYYFQPHILRVLVEFVAVVLLIVVLACGKVALGIDTAVLLLVLGLLMRLQPRVATIQQHLQQIRLNEASIAQLEAVRREAITRRDPTATVDSTTGTSRGAGAPSDRFLGDIAIRDVTVRYGPATVLDRLSLDLPRGATIGIAGESGAGKTTLVDCLVRLVRPDEGKITIGSRDLDDIAVDAWRRRIGYVTQHSVIFDTTVADNIAWNQPGVSRADVIEAAQLAEAHRFIESLPQGYDTVLGGSGSSLSGGQVQRIALARALVGERDLLILDEATASLDSLLEEAIMQRLAAIHGHATTLMIAHRLTTLRLADRIVVIEGGRIAESGSWAELVARDGPFARMWNAQNG